MLNLSKITLLLLASIGLTACGLGSLIEELEKAGDECPLTDTFCEVNEDGVQIRTLDDVNVDALDFTISSSILGVVDQKSGILEGITEPADSPSYDVSYTVVNRESSGNGTDDGFAYYSILPAGGGESRKYVGILPTTDLGNAFHLRLSTAAELKATWRGTLTLLEAGDASESDEFSMEVNFTSRQISTPEGITIPAKNANLAPRTARLNGKFGVVGDPTRTPGQLNGTFDFDDDSLTADTMIGLIGEQGAVGVFSGTYFGGFVASP